MKEATKAKYESLRTALSELGSLAVAYSGGVDSTCLLRVAHDVLGDKVLAVTVAARVHPAAEREAAGEIATAIGAPHVVIEVDVLDLDAFKNNPPDRCYQCKKEVFTRIGEVAAEYGITHVADGSNVDDVGDYRPGMRAIVELGVRSPLRDAGLSKDEIREISRQLGLPTWNKPSYACLATRFPYGTRITGKLLDMVDRAESFLHEIGFTQCRVRCHADGDAATARIEVEPDDIPRLASSDVAPDVVKRFTEMGFRSVTMDLRGYRMGSMNETLTKTESHAGGRQKDDRR